MIEIGVNSFKVEGRMRGIYYIATVILAYRRIIDKILKKSLTKEDQEYYLKVLNRVANRESKEQFYSSLPSEKDQYFLGREEVSNQDFLGLVLEYDEKHKIATIEQRNYFKVGDVVEFFGPNTKTSEMKITQIENQDKEQIQIANHPNMIVKIRVDFPLHKYDMMRVKVIDKQSFL